MMTPAPADETAIIIVLFSSKKLKLALLTSLYDPPVKLKFNAKLFIV